MADKLTDNLANRLNIALANPSAGAEAAVAFQRMATARPNSTVVAADLAFAGGTWGTGATSAAITGTDMAGSVTVTAGTTPAANPQVTLTFHDGAFTKPPIVMADCIFGTSTEASIPIAVAAVNTTSATFQLGGTATTAHTYQIMWVCFSIP